MTDTILAERVAWRLYTRHCMEQTSKHLGGIAGWTGDAVSHDLWRLWKSAYEARRAMMPQWRRRSNYSSYLGRSA